ncbi:putative Phox domain-containing protein [Rosa chinensis]|uniref:Putative Phox domain-containing protein n=1 Tax=Rosa chinensis TaxID=74649 RepID=A0A2P6RVZ6_ROSCH|nr:PX domain-containing protein EREX isoform X1 [Rosa chinensis]PRQ50594.1 putative Phox domain-containing protein [Rosa chinensis]
MNLYAHDLSLLDFNFNLSDPISDPFSHRTTSFFSETAPTDDDDDEGGGGDASDGRGRNRTNGKRVERSPSPPKFRHDGTSPLPLGMDWSPPPRKWDGRDSVWPHNPRTGWSYCITVPSWTYLPKPRGSDPVVFYRVQVGLQSPEGITTTRGILRRFNDFLKLFSELKKAFPLKDLPPAPPKGFLRMKSRILLEERRCSLEDWIEKLLSDIDISRSVLVATFLELEAAARSSFNDPQLISDVNSTSGTAPSSLLQTQSDLSVVAGSSSVTSDNGNDTPYEVSELGTPRYGEDSFANLAMEHSTSDQDLDDSIDTSVKVGLFNQKSVRESLERRSRRQISGRSNANTIDKEQTSENTYGSKPLCMDGTEFFVEPEERKRDGHAQGPSTVSFGSDTSTLRVGNLCGDGSLNLPESSEAPTIADTHDNSDLKFSRAILAAFPHDERQKLNRVLITLQQRLGTAKIDIEDLIARLNQEVAVRQFLTTKVKDLEVELETTQQNCKENIQQAVLNEKERFTQMQWDMEELRRKCLDLELQLRSEQDAREHSELTKISIIQENDILIQELDVSRRQLDNLQKLHEEFEVKSKTDVKLLVKEVKSLRNSQSELKQELSRLMKEKLEVERTLQKEKRRIECAATTNAKLLHECEILRSRLQECSVNFLVEEEDKLILDTSSPSDAVDLLTTSDNRIGLLLAEAQLLAQDVESAVIAVDDAQDIKGGDRMADDELRKMLTDQFVDNARLRMQVNSVIRCALNANIKDENDGDDEDDDEEDSHLRKTVLSKFLER